MEFLFFGLILLAIPFVLPVLAWLSARSARQHFEVLQAQVETLTRVVESQEKEIDGLRASVARLAGAAAGRALAGRNADAPRRPPPLRPSPLHPLPLRQRLSPPSPAAPPQPAARPAAPIVVRPPSPVVAQPPPVRPAPASAPAAARIASPAATQPPSPPPPRPPAPAEPPPPPRAFDWEGLVGVKAFSAIAGVALVIAAVSFLRYSIEAGWLQPPVRVAIGVVVALALLIVCELKAARRYPVTANAMDAAAIAVLFATFFAAHALWNLIPGIAAFALLAVVTALAVLLSIRRESLFIAVLGLLGGFATPALLSTGENRPIPLFAYLLLLNIGLAQVAHRKRWPILTALTLVFTTIYQWGWVMKFLSASSLPLAMSVFLLFPLAAFASVLVRRSRPAAADGTEKTFEWTAAISAAMPLLFAFYLAAVPAYGAHPGLLFGFLFLVAAGLLALAIARGHEILHAVSAVTTLLVMATWMASSYRPSTEALLPVGIVAAFSTFYLLAPLVAGWFSRPFTGIAKAAALRRSASARGICRSGRHRAAVRRPVAADGRAAAPGDVDRVARDQLEHRIALLCRGVLRDCDAGRLVGNASHPRTSERRRRCLRGIRRPLARRAGYRAATVTAAHAGVGRWCRPHPGAVPLVLPFARPRRSGCSVGAGAASCDHQRRALHRKRGWPPAGVVAGREPLLVGRDGVVVVQRGGQRRRAAVASGRRSVDAGHACRPQLVCPCRGRRAKRHRHSRAARIWASSGICSCCYWP